MPEVKLVCDYCGTQWREYLYTGQEVPKCTKCKTNHDVKKQPEHDTDVFGYNKKE